MRQYQGADARKAKLIFSSITYSFNPQDGSDGKTPVRMTTDYRGGPIEIGDVLVQNAAAPGTGSITWRVTRIDNRGIWGLAIRNTIREMLPGEAR